MTLFPGGQQVGTGPLIISLGLNFLLGREKAATDDSEGLFHPALHCKLLFELAWERQPWKNTLTGKVTLNRNSGLA